MFEELWVKKTVSDREWKAKYESAPTYWMLDKNVDGVIVGFSTASTEDVSNKLKSGKLEMQNNDELLLSDVYRRSVNIRPFPLENEQERELRIKQEAFEKKRNDETNN